MKKQAIALAVVAVGLAGCGVTPSAPYRNDRETPLPHGQGMFGDATYWEFRKKPTEASSAPTAPPAAMTAAEQEEFKKWRESSGQAERQEFEEWRAWQEWKRKNPK